MSKLSTHNEKTYLDLNYLCFRCHIAGPKEVHEAIQDALQPIGISFEESRLAHDNITTGMRNDLGLTG